MRIGVDATSWVNRRGYGRFARNSLGRLVALDPGTTYGSVIDEESARSAELPPGAETLRVPLSRTPSEAASADSYRPPADLLRLGAAVSRARFDAFLFPSVYTYFPSRPRAHRGRPARPDRRRLPGADAARPALAGVSGASSSSSRSGSRGGCSPSPSRRRRRSRRGCGFRRRSSPSFPRPRTRSFIRVRTPRSSSSWPRPGWGRGRATCCTQAGSARTRTSRRCSRPTRSCGAPTRPA